MVAQGTWLAKTQSASMKDTSLDGILTVCNHIESDLISDRSKIDNIISRLDVIESGLKIIYDRLPRLEDKTNDAVASAVQPLIEATDKLTKEVKKAGDK